jgi:hypothetical protein
LRQIFRQIMPESGPAPLLKPHRKKMQPTRQVWARTGLSAPDGRPTEPVPTAPVVKLLRHDVLAQIMRELKAIEEDA